MRRAHLEIRAVSRTVKTHIKEQVDQEHQTDILGLQPRDKAAMLGVNIIDFFLEEFT